MAQNSNDDDAIETLEPINEEPLPREEWIYTYADMITLILCFFIILFASQNTNTERLKAISLSLRGGPPASPYVFSGGPSVLSRLEAEIKASKLLKDVSINIDDRGIVAQLGESVLFREDSAQLTANAGKIISKFALLIKVIPNSVTVEGYADASFAGNRFYNNAWDLSAARASRVIGRLEQYGVSSKRMELVSYGSTRPRAVGSEPLIASINNRVEILIHPDNGPPRR